MITRNQSQRVVPGSRLERRALRLAIGAVVAAGARYVVRHGLVRLPAAWKHQPGDRDQPQCVQYGNTWSTVRTHRGANGAWLTAACCRERPLLLASASSCTWAQRRVAWGITVDTAAGPHGNPEVADAMIRGSIKKLQKKYRQTW